MDKNYLAIATLVGVALGSVACGSVSPTPSSVPTRTTRQLSSGPAAPSSSSANPVIEVARSEAAAPAPTPDATESARARGIIDHLGAANSFVEAQNWQAARKEFQAVLDLDPKNAQAKAGLAAVETRIPTPVPQTYSRLEILQVTVAGPQVVVVGATDLPDGCEVSIGIDTPGSPDDKYLGMYLFFPVVGGKVEGRLVAPRPGLTAAERLRFMRGPYEIELMVTPMSTSNAKYIGPKGEYLTGPLATGSDMGFRILDLVRTYNLRLNG